MTQISCKIKYAPDTIDVSESVIEQLYRTFFFEKEAEINSLAKRLFKRHPKKTLLIEGPYDPEEGICKKCSVHCHVPSIREYWADWTYNLITIEESCPAIKTLVKNLFKEPYLSGLTYLIDAPDNLDQKELSEFVNLSQRLLNTDSNLIVFCTPEQADMLRQTDSFLRFPLVNFELPDKSFFLSLFKQRVEGFQDGEAPLPFKDEVVERLAEYSGYVPRNFIQLCNLVLVKMLLQDVTEPCGLDFVEKIDKIDKIGKIDIEKRGPSEREAILSIIQQYKGKWVSLKELSQTIETKLGIQLGGKSLSFLMKEMGFTLRRIKEGRTQIFATPSPLETCPKN